MPTVNTRCVPDAEAVCLQVLSPKLAKYGQGYIGAPKLIDGILSAVNLWWFSIGGGPSSILGNTLAVSMDMDAQLEGVFADRDAAWAFAFDALAAIPITRNGIVQSLHRRPGENPNTQYEYFALAGREGRHGLWHVTVPLRIAFQTTV